MSVNEKIYKDRQAEVSMSSDSGFQYSLFVAAVKVVRKRCGLSYQRFANYTGVSAAMLHFGETGEKEWSPDLREKILTGMLKALDDKIKDDRKAAEEEANERARRLEQQRKEDLELAKDLAFIPEVSKGLTRLADSALVR
jgi:DNA-binding transcriptional regulator YiaG